MCEDNDFVSPFKAADRYVRYVFLKLFNCKSLPVSGFKNLVKLLNENSHCVMEATGYYHYQLAYFLLESGIKLSVENPLAVKRFIQMKLSKIKTDKSDSKLICEYAKQVELKLWQGNSKHQTECL